MRYSRARVSRTPAESIREELERALAANRVHGAYLFEGPPGTGKRATAVWWARRLLAREARPGDDPAVFPAHPDLIVIEPDGAFIRVDQVRELQRRLSLVAHEGGRRVGVLLEAQRLRLEAANALLKSLEEPPRGVTLVLLAEQTEGLPRTLLSRTTRVRFRPEPEPAVAEALRGDGLPDQDARLAAALAGGSAAAARAWAERHLEDAAEIRGFVTRLDTRSAGELLEYAERFRGSGEALRARTELFFDVLGAVARERVEAALAGNAAGAEPWLGCAEQAESARREWRRRNLNAQLVVEGLLLDLHAELATPGEAPKRST